MRGAAFALLHVASAMRVATRAVLWDLDGTLCDSFRLAFDATQDVLAARGHAGVSEAEYHACTRYATPERLARHVGLRPGDAAFERVGAELGGAFDALYISKAVLTNAAVAYAEAVLAAHGLRELFAVVHGADSVRAPKPRPDGLAQCVRELRDAGLLRAPAGSCAGVYIGDSPSDGEAARRAGLATLGVCWGSHPAASLAACAHFDALCATEAELDAALLAGADGAPPSAVAFLLDRDGVLNEDVGYPGVLEPAQLALLPGAARAVGRVCERGHALCVVTNQKSVGAGLTSSAHIDATHARLRAALRLADSRAELGPILVSYGEDGVRPQPKPQPDLLVDALAALGCAAERALMVGDARTDAEAAAACGVRFALVTSSAHGEAAAAELVRAARTAACGAPAFDSGAPVGGGVHADLLAAVEAELARLDCEAAETALERLAGRVDARRSAGGVV
ncbi:hypothetical protein KFE25_004369 [Diacronema lutheri]|uniref:D,D-heptose 1,7-bisphosphate phosphatase n=1 Tax=Diacronema lutheri TaxID=2081491 RepID=A0A8J6C6T0_DIALT|nr:hypothetical protein KFE25_004369 [Diacronema lutheri]